MSRINRFAARLLAVCLLTVAGGAHAGTDLEFFENNIRPLLVKRCYECHSADEKIKAGLQLDVAEGWKQGGETGPALVPGDPELSLLIRAVRYQNADLEMPPKGRLPDVEIALLEEWVKRGAPDPRSGKQKMKREIGIDLEEGRRFWVFLPLVKPDLPAVADSTWPLTPVDFFIREAQESKGISPVATASPEVMLRRIYFDLTGLPPSVQELKAFVENPDETRYRATVDRLLASPGFGEKWGRHWLDLARFSESTGGGRSAILPDSWRYRNYVIDSFNADKPFDQFIREQVAGDLLPSTDDRQRADCLVATGFLALGPKNLDQQDKELLRMNTVDEQIDTMGRTFLGMTLGCARCHDHKFDPVPMSDYYALAGIFRSTKTLVLGNVSTLVHRTLPLDRELEYAHEVYQEKKHCLKEQIAQFKKDGGVDAAEQINALEAELKSLEQSAPPPLPKAVSIEDQEDPGDSHLLLRGNVHDKGPSVARGFLQVMGADNARPEIPAGSSGRLELANWLVSANNPVTPRVYANRLWHHLFGSGLVKSVDNFGVQGDRPTHPALLDYLASELVRSGWSTKTLIRELVLSRTYRLGSFSSEADLALDPANSLWWRMPRRRLPAEAIRDAMLSVSGQLKAGQVDTTIPDSVRGETALSRARVDVKSLLDPPVRSVYVPVFREEGMNPLFEVFGFANPSFTSGRRSTTTLPTQSLFLLNDPFVINSAALTARRLVGKGTPDRAKALDELYLAALGRLPGRQERILAEQFLGESGTSNADDWALLIQAVFASVDFRYLN